MKSEPYQPKASRPISDMQLPCPECSKVFASHAALTSHRARIHGVRNNIKKFFANTTCPVCLINYGTRQKAFIHMAYKSKRCGAFLCATSSPMTNEETAAIDLEYAQVGTKNLRAGLHFGYSNIPLCKAAGPMIPRERVIQTLGEEQP